VLYTYTTLCIFEELNRLKPILMKNMSQIFIALTFLLTPLISSAQVSAAEPEFVNTIVHLTKENMTVILERQKAQVKTSSNASTYIIGIGKTKAIGVVKGEKSDVRLSKADTLKFIARVKDNNEDPFEVITFAKFEVNPKKNVRYVEIGKVEAFKGPEDGDINRITFQAVKFGTQSYLITVKNLEPGEYMMTLKDARATAQMFGVD